MRTPMLRRSAQVAGVILLLLVFAAFASPAIPYRIDISEHDVINGYLRVHSSTLGISYGEKLVQTEFGKLVQELRLQRKPIWYKTSHTEHGLGWTLDACPLAGKPAADLKTFMTFVELDEVDNLTSEVLAIQKAASHNDMRILEDYTKQLITRLNHASRVGESASDEN